MDIARANILGSNEEDLLNILDSEIATLQEIHRALQGRTYRSHNYNEFDREIFERFNDAGFTVKVKWYDTDVDGVKAPTIEVIGRITKVKEFDHDQMRHEVVNNLLGLPTEDAGIIKSDGFVKPEPHKH